MFFSSDNLDLVAVAVAFAFPAAFAALAQGRLCEAAFNGMSRQPEAAGDIKGSLIIALAFPEALGLFGWVLGAIFILGRVAKPVTDVVEAVAGG